MGRRRDARLFLPALCDFLEGSASVSDSAVLPAGDCGWTWFEVGQEPWPVLCAQYRYGTWPAIVDGHGSRLVRSLGQFFVLNIDMGLTDALAVGHTPDMNMKIKTESPRLAVTPGEWYASDLLAMTSTGFRLMDDIPNVIGAVKLDCRTVWSFPQIDSTAVGSGAVELDDLNFRRTSFPPDERVTIYGWPH